MARIYVPGMASAYPQPLETTAGQSGHRSAYGTPLLPMSPVDRLFFRERARRGQGASA